MKESSDRPNIDLHRNLDHCVKIWRGTTYTVAQVLAAMGAACSSRPTLVEPDDTPDINMHGTTSGGIEGSAAIKNRHSIDAESASGDWVLPRVSPSVLGLAGVTLKAHFSMQF